MLELYSRSFIRKTFLDTLSWPLATFKLLPLQISPADNSGFSLSILWRETFSAVFLCVHPPFPCGIPCPRFLLQPRTLYCETPSGKWRLVYHALHISFNLLPLKSGLVCMPFFQWDLRKRWLAHMVCEFMAGTSFRQQRCVLKGSFLQSSTVNFHPLWQVDKVI